MSLPLNLPKRGLSKDEPAEYRGVSVNTSGRYGRTPTKIVYRTVYDRRVFNHWLDELADFGSTGLPIDTPEEAFLEAIHAREATVCRTSRRLLGR